MNTTEAVGYMRCSGRGQIEGDTWDRQTAAIERYAAAQGLTIVQWYRDEGISGKNELDNRPGLAACLERIENNGVKIVLVESADRLARDLMVSEVIIRQFQRAGGTIIAAGPAINLTDGDDTNPTAKLIRQILSAIAEFDKTVTVLKLRAARQRKKAKEGRCEGRKAYGHDPKYVGEILILNEIYDLQLRKLTSEKIANDLNARQFTTRSGKPWRASTIRKILARNKRVTNSCASTTTTQQVND